MTWVRRGILAFLGVKMANLVVNLFRFPVLRDTARDDSARISLLVPVRDEADRLPATLSGLLSQGVPEVIFLDDGSSDDTVALLQRGIDDRANDQRANGQRAIGAARVVRGSPTPSGWAGKTWAMQQLGAAATGDVLVFCDADVHLAPGAIDAVRAEMRRQHADVFSVFPRQITATIGEHLLVPLIDDVLLCFLAFPLLAAPVPAAATANGSLIAFARPAFADLDGFAAVRAAVVEDVAIARHTRNRGHRLGLALGGELAQTRMYDNWPALVTGFARGLRPVVGGSRAAVIIGWIGHVAVYTLPVVALVTTRRGRWLVPTAVAILERLLVEAKTGRRHWAQAALTPLSPLAAAPVVWRSLRRDQVWKGRTYR
jgi:cellulose synthase/poly-beta-1,6-N-acetylglucosamine synthase-like glycosyltransferase